ncbi:MAG: Crp/Fnr family transcriptional regulator [Spirochaetes bacterium]|nr:Crp/Fnr family transcriptional regulator [Spirochaetota bacterium]
MNIKEKKLYSLKRLKESMKEQIMLPEEEWEYAVRYFSVETYEKNTYLAKAGERIHKVFSLMGGMVRFYYISDSGKEFNKYFVLDNRFFSSFSSLFLDKPCGFYIQALEDTEVLAMPKSRMEELYYRHSCWERLGRLSAIAFINHMEEREKEFLLDPLDVRYRKFLAEYPDLIHKIPQYHIASYLGVTDVALSRLRKRKNLP